jgi:uncharacterized protein involved in tolerance to divalent cations
MLQQIRLSFVVQRCAELGGHVVESHCAVITTTNSAEAAEELGRGIVEARLGACVEVVGPIRLPIVGGSDDYFSWVTDETRPT